MDYLQALITASYYFLAIYIPAILVAGQEIEVEGPFGWGSCLPTYRYPTKHWFSRLFRLICGPDKWATGFNAFSATIWLLIYLAAPWYHLYQSLLSASFDWVGLACEGGIAIASWIAFMLTEDFLWFVLNPYYGPGRFDAKHIPWLLYFQGSVPTYYLSGTAIALAIASAAAVLTGHAFLLLGWLIGLFGILAACWLTAIIARHYIRTKPLAAHWELEIRHILVTRSPFPNEHGEPDTDTKVWVVPEKVFRRLAAEQQIIPLDEYYQDKTTLP